MMTGGDIPALVNFNNVYARYDADSGEYDPPSLEPGTAFEKKILCPFAVYYLRYAVRSFFTMSRISPADDKRAGQKLQRKIAVAVQKVKPPLLFVPLF